MAHRRSCRSKRCSHRRRHRGNMRTVEGELNLSGMDLYGIRALTHVANHCPRRFASIADPVSYFSTLGEEIRSQVEAVEEALMGPLLPLEEQRQQTTGMWNMARLSAEEQVFGEMVYGPFPAEDEEDLPVEPDDLPSWMVNDDPDPPGGWRPMVEKAAPPED